MQPKQRHSGRIRTVMPAHRLVTRALAVIALTAAAGCAPFARQAFRTPTVELKDVRVRALGLEGGAIDLVLDVFNPNEYRMDATRLTYTLIADSSKVADGAINHRVTLTGREHNAVTMPVTFSVKQLFSVAEVLLRKGSVDYVVKGEVTVDTPFGSMTRPYEGKARLDNGSLLRP